MSVVRLTFVCLLPLLLPGAYAAAATVSDVRVGLHPEKTRLVIETTARVPYEIYSLADPYRLVVDFEGLEWPDSLARTRLYGVVAGLRFGLFRDNVSRLVVELKAPAVVSERLLLAPREGYGWRLVLDLAESDRTGFLAALRPPSVAMPERNGSVAYPRPRLKPNDLPRPRVIVLDPGHGGVDPGAIGLSGGYEKHLTLAFSLQLAELLRERGYRVVLTRTRDIFVPLRRRVEIARAAGGDLMISVHADSLDNAKVRGAAIYTLSETASDEETAALATQANKADTIAGVDLNGQDDEVATILIDLAQRETMNYAARFANLAVDEMDGTIRLRTRPHRFAGFRVLKAPDVASVLLELGYLSNPDEERYLSDSAARRRIAGTLVQAIDRYFGAIRR